MKKKLIFSFFIILVISMISGCTSMQKESYDDVLIPIVTVIPYGTTMIDGEIVDESTIKDDEKNKNSDYSISVTDESSQTNDSASAENEEITDISENDDEIIPENQENGAQDDEISDNVDIGENVNPDSNSDDISDTEKIIESSDIDELPDDGFSYDLTSGLRYSPEICYSARDIERLYQSKDRFAVFKALKGKKIDDMSDDEFAVLAPTSRMEFVELVGDNGVYNGYPEAFPYAGTYKLVVDLKYQIVMAYIKDADGEYTIPVRYMKCSSGGSGNDTPDGSFKMKDYRVRFALFKSANSFAQYWSLIFGKIYFHSILYSELDASKYTSSSYNNLGKACSHGCIRLCVPDARWIWYNIAPDTPCDIIYGTKEDTETIAIKNRLKLAECPDERPKMNMGEIPWTDNWKIEDVPQEQPFVNGSQD